MTTAATKTGEHVGKKAGDKIVKMSSKNSKSKKVPKKVSFNNDVTVKIIPKKKNDRPRDKSKSESNSEWRKN